MTCYITFLHISGGLSNLFLYSSYKFNTFMSILIPIVRQMNENEELGKDLWSDINEEISNELLNYLISIRRGTNTSAI